VGSAELFEAGKSLINKMKRTDGLFILSKNEYNVDFFIEIQFNIPITIFRKIQILK
jgi:hypothetical protein